MEGTVKSKGIIQSLENSYLSYFLMYNFYYLSWALFSALIAVYLMNMGFIASDVSLVVSISFLTSMVTQPMIGSLNERYDLKIVNSILFVIAAIGAIMFMLSKSLVMIMISYSIVLMILNGVNPVMEKIATTSPYQYGKIRIWGTIGYASGSQIAGIIYEKISPQAMFIAFVGTITLCIIGMLLTRPNYQVDTNVKQKTKTTDLFKNKKFMYYLLICALFYGVTNMGNTFIPSMLTDKGLDVGIASTILSLAVFCEAPLVLFSNKFMDRTSNKTLLMISIGLVCVQCAVYSLDLPMFFIIIATLIAKHPAGMLYYD